MNGDRWLSSWSRRAIDIVIASVAALMLSPVVAVVTVLVRSSHGRPALFSQVRAGRDGAPITVPKFRSMTDARDERGVLLADGERLTPVGSRLRSTSLDELPQLWSVIKGDMSMIGPRPLPVAYVERYSTEQRRRLDARPGITGWAQVQGRNALSWPDKLALDVWYVDNASPRLDVEILLRTIRAVVSRDGVSADGHATMPEFMGET